jgi:hypothetical protein
MQKRKWQWSPWYAATVSAHNRALSAPTMTAGQLLAHRQWQYAEWLADRYGWSQSEALDLVQSMGETVELSAEDCRIGEVETLQLAPKPVKIAGATIQPLWNWSPLYRKHVTAQLNAQFRPMKAGIMKAA